MMPEKIAKGLIATTDLIALSGAGFFGFIEGQDHASRFLIGVAIALYVIARALKVLAQAYKEFMEGRVMMAESQNRSIEGMKKIDDLIEHLELLKEKASNE